MVMLGYPNTLAVTMEEMLHHCRAVKRGQKRALLVGDMPFMSYQTSATTAVKNAGRFIKEGHMQAVKCEGGRVIGRKIQAILESGIPVMGHLGVLPQSIHKTSGYRVRGKDIEDETCLIDEALYLESLGVFAIVLECVVARAAEKISKRLHIPSIGIGAGPGCDGQILVCHDLLGYTPKEYPRFVKSYARLGDTIPKAFLQYKNDVHQKRFPTKKHSYF